ncbi:hypothetical protein [Gemmata massiliana]|uniref:hypothetical protein n=1 Tax=Gemmata massiliana TaxID=1210884 RepID=UPI001E52A2E8|nr:hypothetical protein [Gemmata massiliana]
MKSPEAELRIAIETAEDYADFGASKQQVKATRRLLVAFMEETRQRQLQDKAAVPEWAWNDPERAEWWPNIGTDGALERQVRLAESVLQASRFTAESLTFIAHAVIDAGYFTSRDRPGDLSDVCDLLRDIFGNPFRPLDLPADWCTSTAFALAAQMYDSRDFSAMPVLADALQDAGCEDDVILTHCRDPKQVHVRGCWIVDLLLGKE